jgi:hypothetical protein
MSNFDSTKIRLQDLLQAMEWTEDAVHGKVEDAEADS